MPKSNLAPQHTLSAPTFFASFIQTLKDIFVDKGVLLMLIIAPVIYGFFYPWPYSTEVVNHVPVGIIDNDNSNLSRTIIRYASASPQLDTQRFINEHAAKEAMWSDQIAGYIIIPTGLERQVLSGKAANVIVLGNGGYFILNKNVQLGFLQAVSTVSAGIEVKYTSRAPENNAVIQSNRGLWRLRRAGSLYSYSTTDLINGDGDADWYVV